MMHTLHRQLYLLRELTIIQDTVKRGDFGPFLTCFRSHKELSLLVKSVYGPVDVHICTVSRYVTVEK